MKHKLFPLFILVLAAASLKAEILLAGWDFSNSGNRDQPAFKQNDVSAIESVMSNYTFSGNKYSNNGLWGTKTFNPSSSLTDTSSSAFNVDFQPIQQITISLKDFSSDYVLSSLSFQYLIPFNASPRDFTVTYQSGLDGVAGPVTLFSFTDSGKTTDWTGQDIDLASFFTNSQLTISGGDSVVFSFDFRDANKTGTSFLDNIAITSIPESSTYSLILGLAGFSFLCIWRYNCR